MTAPDTSPAAIAAPAFTFDAPYEAYTRTGLFGEYVALHRAGELVATFSFREWGGEPTAIQAAWNFAYRVETCAECDALSAERDRLAAQVVQLQRNEKLALAQVDRLLALTNKIDDDLQESRKYAEALVQELKDRAIKADVLRDAAQALGAMPEGYCFCSANRIGDDSKTHEPECADLRAALTALEKPHD